MTPSEFSEHKERDVVLVLHHRHVGVMNARSCAKRMHAAFFRGERFLHGTFNGHWRRPICSARYACGVRDMQSRATTRAFARSCMTEISDFHRFTVCIAYLPASVVHAGIADTNRWPREDRFYRPPTAAPLSLKPDGHFQPLWWLKSAGPGGHWLGLDVPSTGTVCGGAIGDATGTHGELWYSREVTLCYKRYVLYHPGLHLPGPH